jgi:hypothetical protein
MTNRLAGYLIVITIILVVMMAMTNAFDDAAIRGR